MHESPEDNAALDDLLAWSLAGVGEYLRGMFTSVVPAGRVTGALGGILEMHLATATSSGAPFVAPIGCLFYRSAIWFGVPTRAVRQAFLRRDAGVSISYTRD